MRTINIPFTFSVARPLTFSNFSVDNFQSLHKIEHLKDLASNPDRVEKINGTNFPASKFFYLAFDVQNVWQSALNLNFKINDGKFD